MPNSILIYGDTYPLRRKIAELKGIYDYEEKAHRLPYNEINMLRARNQQFDIHTSDIIIDERYRVYQKNLKNGIRSDRWTQKVERAKQKYDSLELSRQEKDFLSLGEPIKIGHHSEKRHRKLVEKSWKRMGQQVEQYELQVEAERKSEYWKNKKYLTSDEKKERKERVEEIKKIAIDLWKKNKKIGDEYVFGNRSFIITKINQKSVTIESGSRREIQWDNDFARCVEEANQLYLQQK